MRAVARTLVPYAAVLIGCGGETNISGSRGPIGASGGGTDAGTASGGHSGLPSSGSAGAGGAAFGGRGGSLPSSRDASVAGASGGPADGGAPVCPIRVSGTDLTEADCYACIQPGAECGSVTNLLGSLTVEICVARATSTWRPSVWCKWYADGADAHAINNVQFCKVPSGGTVWCGGGV